MAALILTILKITGLVLAGIIGLVLLLFILVLFVPIRYRLHADKEDNDSDFTASVSVTYLLHILSARFYYEKEIGYCIRIFGIKVRPRKEKEVSVNTDTGHIEEKPAKDPEQETVEEDYSIDWNDIHEPETPADEEYSDDDQDEDLRAFSEKISGIIDSILDKYESIKEKYEKLRKEYRFWDKMIHDERNRNAADLIKRLIFKLIRRIKPKKIKGYIHFGFEDPATTGKILSYLALIYPVLPKKLVIDPGFNDTQIYGKLDAKGHFALIFPVVYALRIYFNKDVKRMRRIYKRHSEKTG